MKKQPAPRKRKVTAAKTKAKKPPASGRIFPFSALFQQSKVQPSLLSPDSPEERGFTLLEHWRGLFRLYVRGEEVEVQMDPELAEVEAEIVRGSSKIREGLEQEKEEQLLSLEQALWRVWMYNAAQEHKEGLDQGGKQWLQTLALEAVEMIGFAMSPHLEEFLSSLQLQQSKPERKAHTASCALDALLRCTLRRMTKVAFPWDSRAKGSGGAFPKELLAIWHAKMLCGDLRRLPTKTEVRQRLEAIGVGYKKDKNEKKNWEKLFLKAGLDDLPD